jgi:serine/threonine-protein kinase
MSDNVRPDAALAAEIERLQEENRRLRALLDTYDSGMVEPPQPSRLSPALAVLEETADDTDSREQTPTPPERLPESGARYGLSEEIGHGAMGQVFLAYEPLLGREVALKTLGPSLAANPEARARFVAEARVTGGLGHPNIVPVFELGKLPGDGLYFAMQRVRGRSLSEVLHAASQGDSGRYGRHQLVRIVHQVCLAVAYAHTRGVLHRDLKPQNVMVGDFGEVYLMDWGLAKAVKDDPRADWWFEGRTLADVYSTQAGRVRGTPVYMSPEQAQGRNDAINERTDVFGLGAILYEVLTFRAPVAEVEVRPALLKAALSDIQPPRARAPELDIPPELEEICLTAMAPDPARRYASAQDLARDLELYLDGAKTLERKRSESRALAIAGEEATARLLALEADTADSARRLSELRLRVSPAASLEQKRPLWAEEDQLASLRLEHEFTMWEAADLFHQALALDPGNAEAQERLGALFCRRALWARERRERKEARIFGGMARRFAPELAPLWLEGESAVFIQTNPPGAEIFFAPYEERDRALRPGELRPLGVSPLEVKLRWGSGLLVVRAPGYAELQTPVWVRPHYPLELSLNLYTPQELGDGFCHIPAGAFFFGGDPEAGGVDARTELCLNDFFVSRRHVTCGEYAAFLNAIAARSPQQAALHVPRLRPGEAPFWVPGHDGRYSLPCRDFDGTVWEKEWPVVWVSLADAESYASFRSARDQVRYRLLNEEEWEKAARGVDGRLYPWGDRFDPSFCRMSGSAPGHPLPGMVGSAALDRSPFGVWDMGGNAADLTTSAFAPNDRRKVVKGGAYSWSAESCRATWRVGVEAHQSNGPWGFRLVKDPPREAPRR